MYPISIGVTIDFGLRPGTESEFVAAPRRGSQRAANMKCRRGEKNACESAGGTRGPTFSSFPLRTLFCQVFIQLFSLARWLDLAVLPFVPARTSMDLD